MIWEILNDNSFPVNFSQNKMILQLLAQSLGHFLGSGAVGVMALLQRPVAGRVCGMVVTMNLFAGLFPSADNHFYAPPHRCHAYAVGVALLLPHFPDKKAET